MAQLDRELLKNLGFTNNEIEIYIHVLAGGSIGAGLLAERTGLHRQACYDALERLMKKGFVSFVVKNGKKNFQALSPSKLVDHVEELRHRMEDMVPALENLAKAAEAKPFVEVYTGKNALRLVLSDIINNLQKSGQEIAIIGVDESEFLAQDKPAVEQYIRRMNKWNLNEKLLTIEGAKVLFPGKQSQYRFLPRKFFNPNPTYIYGNKVVHMIWGPPLYAIMVESQQVADNLRKQFQLLWKMARKK